MGAFGRNYFTTCASVSDEDKDESEERAQIISDISMLKKQATLYLHPEAEVKSTVGSRCYFDRASAPEVLSKDEADEQAKLLVDVANSKKLAVDYLCPGNTVKSVDPSAFGRNYFTTCAFDPDEIEA